MSTKIPEYLSSGKPIICLSKPGIASYAYLSKNSAALFAKSIENIQHILCHLDDSNREQVVKNARQAFERDFNTNAKKAEFREYCLKFVAESVFEHKRGWSGWRKE